MQFSLSRFLSLFRLQLAINRKLYYYGTGAIAGIMLCYMIYAVYSFSEGLSFDVQVNCLLVGMLGSSIIYGSMIFKQYSEKTRRTQAILLPVSNLERLAVALLFSFVLFPLVFILLYFICVIPVNAWDVSRGNMNEIFVLDGLEGWYLLAGYLYIQSLVLLCAISFRRYLLVKTILMICLVTLCIAWGNQRIHATRSSSVTVTPQGDVTGPKVFIFSSASPFKSLRLTHIRREGEERFNDHYWVSLPAGQQALIMFLLGLMPLFAFYITAVKLREQQL